MFRSASIAFRKRIRLEQVTSSVRTLRTGSECASRTQTQTQTQTQTIRSGFPRMSMSSLAGKEEAPRMDQLRILAFRAGIPMIGFGIMDNMVMITAGEAIDSTLGVALGISTMAAAGLGQCCSDVAGLTSGGLVDAAVSKLKLPHHGLSPKQLDSKRARMYSTFGACVGVVTGCLIGMSVLLFMDTDKVDRARRAKELKSIFESVMEDGHHLVGAERATLFMVDEEARELWSQVATGTDGIIKVPLSRGCVGQSVTTGTIINVSNAYENPNFDRSIDEKTGYTTENILVVPILSKEENNIIGAIQLLNKRSKDDSIVPFTPDDEKIAKVLASHVAAFIQIVEGS